MKTFTAPTLYTEQQFLSFVKTNTEILAANFKSYAKFYERQNGKPSCNCVACVVEFSGREFVAEMLRKVPADVMGDMPFEKALVGAMQMFDKLLEMGAPPSLCTLDTLNGYLRGLAVKNAVASGYDTEEAVKLVMKAEGKEDAEIFSAVVGHPSGEVPVFEGAENCPPLKGPDRQKPHSPHNDKLQDILANMVAQHSRKGGE